MKNVKVVGKKLIYYIFKIFEIYILNIINQKNINKYRVFLYLMEELKIQLKIDFIPN